MYSIGDCTDYRPDYLVTESRRVANYYREQLRKDDRYSWILDDLLLSDKVKEVPKNITLHATLKVWDMNAIDDQGIPQCIRTIRLFDRMEEEIITSFAVCEVEELAIFGCANGRIFYRQGTLQRSTQTMLSLFPPHFTTAITNIHVTYKEDVSN